MHLLDSFSLELIVGVCTAVGSVVSIVGAILQLGRRFGKLQNSVDLLTLQAVEFKQFGEDIHEINVRLAILETRRRDDNIKVIS